MQFTRKGPLVGRHNTLPMCMVGSPDQVIANIIVIVIMLLRETFWYVLILSRKCRKRVKGGEE